MSTDGVQQEHGGLEREQIDGVRIPAQLLPSFGNLGILFNLSVPQFLYL